MIGALAVATSVGLPDSDLLVSMSAFSLVPLILIIVAIVLIMITQRRALSYIPASSTVSRHTSSIFHFPLKIVHYLLIALLIIMLLIGSAWQALSQHQQAEAAKITETMRVQAWVTIEGISDSVYDPETNSGYRQVALLRSISPLVSDLTAQDLNVATDKYVAAQTQTSLVKNKNEDKQYRILLNAYPKHNKNDTKLTGLNNLKPGDQLLMTLTLAPLKTSQEVINNSSGFDSYRWLRARHIDGVANVIATGSPINTTTNSSMMMMTSSDSYLQRLRVTIDQGRWQLRQHFYREWARQPDAQQQANAVTLSLLTGDRSLINHDTKDLYQLSGISHLLAISGTHVLFLAIVLAGLVTLLIDRKWSLLYRTIPRWQVRWWVMIGAAFIYALFTGFDVPAARTAWMLLAIGLVRLTLLPISTIRVLLALAILMAWFDPYVLWQAGYWLSFIAVALLLKYDDSLQLQNKNVSRDWQQPQDFISEKSNLPHKKLWLLFKRIFKLQCWLFIALLPVSLLLFGKVSLWGLVINLFAIGLFGWVIVPLNLLAGLCYLILPPVADSIWAVVSTIVANLHELMAWLTALPALKGAWLYTPINTGILLMALLVMLPWLLPRGLISRWLVLPPLMLLMMTIYANQQALTLTPTLYVLPTGDRYVTAALLQYPINNDEISNGNGKLNKENELESSLVSGSVSWLFLADHRPNGTRTMPSSLTAEQLSATLEQQLRTLSVSRLEGIVVQTSVATLTSPLANSLPNKKSKEKSIALSPELLPMTVAQLVQSMPVSRYWQAGRSERWSTRQQTYLTNNPSKTKTLISAQRCELGKTWQLPSGDLTLEAVTGWPTIDDNSVWDCALAIDSRSLIQVVQYNATNPQQSAKLTAQKLESSITPPKASINKTLKAARLENRQINQPTKSSQSRLILDASTHPRVWELWSLLCEAKPFAINSGLDNSTMWLSHSASQVSADILTAQHTDEVITYDNEPLEAALSLGTETQVD
ncbi:ComEC/Rec2 family competence protein [Psychrobacter frigidicola]|nr:ComEC/Rec2 family competence protein [Psychrobacter frigidicola]